MSRIDSNGVVQTGDYEIVVEVEGPGFYSPQSPNYSMHSCVFREGGYRPNPQPQAENTTEEQPEPGFYSPQSPNYSMHSSVFREGGHRLNPQPHTEAQPPVTGVAAEETEVECCYCSCHHTGDVWIQCSVCSCIEFESSYEDPDDTLLDATYEFELDMD